MNAAKAKQFIELAGRPILTLAIEPFQDCEEVDAVFLVAPPADVTYCRERIVHRYNLSKVHLVVPGGLRRQDSVRLGIEATRGLFDRIIVHDGVRPLISQNLLDRLLSASKDHRAVASGLPAKETVKEATPEGLVVKTYPRDLVWLVQTPQVFLYEDILKAHQKAEEEGWEEVTDDACLLERMGIPVQMVMGADENIKITTPFDLELARFLMAAGNIRYQT